MTFARRFFIVSVLLIACRFSFAAPEDSEHGDPERTRFGQNIYVAAGEHPQEVTCFFCSIYLRGQVSGDVTAIGGKVVLEEPAQVGGDVTAIVGDVVVGSGTKIAGDLSAVGGRLQRSPTAVIGGEVTPIQKSRWLTLLLVSPLVVIGVLIAATVWFVRYLRRPRIVRAAV